MPHPLLSTQSLQLAHEQQRLNSGEVIEQSLEDGRFCSVAMLGGHLWQGFCVPGTTALQPPLPCLNKGFVLSSVSIINA